MISEKHSAAARANGAHSRGPKTPEGLARCSRKATRHGLLSPCLLVGSESRQAFEKLFNLYIDRFEPLDDVEFGFVEEMISAFWRIRRNWAIETELMNQATAKRSGGDPLPALAAGFSELAADPKLALLQRHEARLSVIQHRALEHLLMLRHPALRNEPSKCPVSITSEIEGPMGPKPLALPAGETAPESQDPE